MTTEPFRMSKALLKIEINKKKWRLKEWERKAGSGNRMVELLKDDVRELEDELTKLIEIEP